MPETRDSNGAEAVLTSSGVGRHQCRRGRYIRKAFSGLGGVNADHSERQIPVLMPSEPVPQTHQEDSQQLVKGIEVIDLG
jgi:hypothetical protein